ncbi:hypothetical protein [Deinococcus peraridilitoris]|uniref:DsrE/DsrF-like family protein n=1 Tax=Deinococcus peraridilitoris (strain DSM 19664 / LMG 22246 / CIP 109416 / KR-200) TaxID=937777 RepID=L0A8A2_DEIPD|nr:hypothetical protein [Deinococcus peraridilitoris]AFZ69639.1 hypothetical protein Deipe_4298 [Deinococcus peraridilitoris DSM 19664]
MPSLKIAVVIFEDIKRDSGRVYRALITAEELIEAGEDVTVVFDGSGTESLAAVLDPDSRLHTLFERIRPHVRGACKHCARSHRVADVTEAAGIALLSEYKQHASLPALVREGYTVLTF